MKSILIYLSLFCFCSCAIKKLQRPTTVVDLKTGTKIKENSIRLENGKMCYIYTAQYDGKLFGKSILKNVSSSNFFPTNGVSVDDLFNGGASTSAKVDTVIKSEFIVQMALQEALINSPIGFQYQYVPQSEFVDREGNINTPIVRNKFNPDIIINLKSLSLKMNGDANTGYSEVRSEPRNVNYGLYAYSSPFANFYGNILMDYTAIWEIQYLKKNSAQSIKQTGRYVSAYYDGYSINEEVMICAKKIGKEFSD